VAVLVKCCLNGARPLDEHPGLPRTAEDAAAEAAAAVAAGAGAIHVHPRNAEGAESLDPETIAAWVGAIRAACPSVPVGVSTGAWIQPDLEARVAQIATWRDPLPDFASVNVSEDGFQAVAQACLQRGVAIEAGLFDASDAARLIDTGSDLDWLRVLVEVGDHREVASVDAALDDAAFAVPRLYHGFNADTWVVIREARRRGRDVRVGLEDVLALPDGSLARGNTELVAAALALAPS